MQCEHHCFCKRSLKRFRKIGLDATSSGFGAYPEPGVSQPGDLDPVS